MSTPIPSMCWTDEEARYLRALFRWQDGLSPDRAGETSPPIGSPLRVLLTGPRGGGKTALVTRFCTDTFEPDARFHHGSRHVIDLDGLPHMLDILELPLDDERDGDDNFAALEHARAITDATVVVYDTAVADSRRVAQRLYTLLLDADDGPVLLVAAKSDLVEGDPDGPAGTIAASAKTGDHVTDVFVRVGRAILQRQRASHIEATSTVVAAVAAPPTARLHMKRQNASLLGRMGVLRALGLFWRLKDLDRC